MLDRLEMPDTLARLSLEDKERIGKQIVACAVAAIKVKGSGTGRNKYQAALFIQAHPAPTVSATTIFPGVLGPGIVAQFTKVRDSVKGPAKFSRTHVIGADVSGSGRQVLTDNTA